MTFTAPKSGDGATVHVGSDSYPYTVTDVANNSLVCVVKVQEDNATPCEGHDYYNKQMWQYKTNPNGEIKMFRLVHDDGRGWREIWLRKSTGRYVLRTPSVYRLDLGGRHKRVDPSF